MISTNLKIAATEGRLRARVLALFLLLAGPAVPAFALEAGWAKLEINPPFSAPLAGYAARWGAHAQGTRDSLHARAVVIKQGREKIAMVSGDLVLITRRLRDEVTKRLAPLQLSGFLLHATHTHSGIGGYWSNLLAEWGGMGKYDQRIFDFLVERIVEAVTAADRRRMPAKIGMAFAPVQGMNRNRRQKSEPVDLELSVIRIDDLQGNAKAAIVNFAAHPTVLTHENLAVSADYPGFVSATLERRVEVALFASGASGDVGAQRPRGQDRYESARSFGLKLADRAAAIMANARTQDSANLKSVTEEVSLPKATLHGMTGKLVAFAADPLFRIFTSETTLLQTIRINDFAISAWPGEVVSRIGLDLKKDARRRLGYEQLFLVTLANDHLGYIQSEEGFERGELETSLSFYGPRLGTLLAAKAMDQLRAVKCPGDC